MEMNRHYAVLPPLIPGCVLKNCFNEGSYLRMCQIKGMQAEVVHRTDGSFTDLGLVKKGEAEMANRALLPTWMRIDGLSLTDSMLVIRDAANGHKYLLDEITFSLPSTAPKEGETEPTLHALINGNPIQIRGQRQIRPDGSSATRLILQLDDVDPQQILAWLPGIKQFSPYQHGQDQG